MNRNLNLSTSFSHTIAIALTAILLCAWTAGEGIATGQEPDPNGWADNAALPNQPVSLAARPKTKAHPAPEAVVPLSAPEPLTAEIPAEIRAAIGLASLETEPREADPTFIDLISKHSEQLTAPDGIQSSIKIALLLAALSLAPAIVLMTTCYIRVVVVLSLLKQAFGGQQLPPTQVVTALSLFLTFLIMTPVWNEVKKEAIDPYSNSEQGISWNEAWQRGAVPVRNFMIRQIELADNAESVAVFYKYLPETASTPPTELSDVPTSVLLPAFMVSELKVAFLLGFQIFLPFLVLDLVVSSVTVSMGMVMLPPNMVSFPLKLILFVMVDGWNLVVGMLLQSFG